MLNSSDAQTQQAITEFASKTVSGNAIPNAHLNE